MLPCWFAHRSGKKEVVPLIELLLKSPKLIGAAQASQVHHAHKSFPTGCRSTLEGVGRRVVSSDNTLGVVSSEEGFVSSEVKAGCAAGRVDPAACLKWVVWVGKVLRWV